METLATLSTVNKCLFGYSVNYMSGKKALTTSEMTLEEAEKFRFKRDVDLVQERLEAWHNQKEFQWKYTWHANNFELYQKFAPMLPVIKKLCVKLKAKDLTQRQAAQIALMASQELDKVEPRTEAAIPFNNWFRIKFLVDLFKNEYQQKEIAVTA